MRKNRIKISDKLKTGLEFNLKNEVLLVTTNIKMTLYKHIGSQGGIEVIEPMYLKPGLQNGKANWHSYNFMCKWLKDITNENPDFEGRFELLLAPASTDGIATIELENFFKNNGGEATLEEVRNFKSEQNIKKWRNKNKILQSNITYIGKNN